MAGGTVYRWNDERQDSVRRGVVLAAVALVLLSGCAGGQHGASADGPRYGAPRVGSCHALHTSDLVRYGDARNIHRLTDATTRSVPCGGPHTSETIGTLVVPRALLRHPDGPTLAARVTGACTLRFETRAGGGANEEGLSTLHYLLFGPTPAQEHHGARWVRCEMIAERWRGYDTLPGIQALPRDGRPVLQGGRAARYLECLAPTLGPVDCDRPHRYKLAGSFIVSVGGSGEANLRTSADEHCPPIAATRRWTWDTDTDITPARISCYAYDPSPRAASGART